MSDKFGKRLLDAEYIRGLPAKMLAAIDNKNEAGVAKRVAKRASQALVAKLFAPPPSQRALPLADGETPPRAAVPHGLLLAGGR